MDAHITFNAFSFLQKKLKEKGMPCINARLPIEEGIRPLDLMEGMGLAPDEVEVVFINGRVGAPDTRLKAGDRVAFVPPGGTPGPYRVLLGFKSRAEAKS